MPPVEVTLILKQVTKNIGNKGLEILITVSILSEITEQVTKDMGKFSLGPQVTNKINEGWRWGSISAKNKTHPRPKKIGITPRKPRRIPDYDTTDIMEWLRNPKII